MRRSAALVLFASNSGSASGVRDEDEELDESPPIVELSPGELAGGIDGDEGADDGARPATLDGGPEDDSTPELVPLALPRPGALEPDCPAVENASAAIAKKPTAGNFVNRIGTPPNQAAVSLGTKRAAILRTSYSQLPLEGRCPRIG